jgi:predicted metal-dependent hydrolase
MKQELFLYGDYSYQYYLVQQDRRTVSLTVQPSLNIILKCPHSYSPLHIEKFLKRKWHWMEKQLRDLRRFQRKHLPKEFISGEACLYLGRQYKLVVASARTDAVRIEKGRIRIETTQKVDNVKHNKKMIESWYEDRAETVFQERYKLIIKKFDYDFIPVLAIRQMEKRWGSFLVKKKILLNPELIKASKECIDYVITHELCHMKYQNHGAAYYRFLSSKCPNWEELKERLELRFL